MQKMKLSNEQHKGWIAYEKESCFKMKDNRLSLYLYGNVQKREGRWYVM